MGCSIVMCAIPTGGTAPADGRFWGLRVVAGRAEREDGTLPRKLPPLLWVSVVVIALAGLAQIRLGVGRNSVQFACSGILSFILVWGLVGGHKWAYVLTVIFASVAVVVAASRPAPFAAFAIVVNGLALVPVLMSTRFFFPPKPGRSPCPDGPDA